MRHTTFDTLIVGQGLAGSALAWHLVEGGERVCVIDDGHRSSSSMVAAGLINPLAGMRFNRRPEVGDWLDYAERWYRRLSARFGQTFHHPLPMLRLFRSPDQRRFYRRRVDDPSSRDLIGADFTAADCPEPVTAPHGGFMQYRTGFIDMPLLLTSLGDWLTGMGALAISDLRCGDIELDDAGVRAGDLRAARLVFCDGARSRNNPWFDWLPLAPDKGEILNLKTADWHPRHIINAAHWLVPLNNGEVRFGATHEHADLDPGPTAAGRAALLAGYHALHPGPTGPEVTQHAAGIRPATSDRYPLIGQHPEHAALWVFNGFGAHGALRIPWYAQAMAQHLGTGTPLPPEADIQRL